MLSIESVIDLPTVGIEIARARKRYRSFDGWEYGEMKNEAAVALCKCYNMGYFKFDIQSDTEISKLARRIVYNALTTVAYFQWRKAPDMRSLKPGRVGDFEASDEQFFDYHTAAQAELLHMNQQYEMEYADICTKLLSYAAKKGGIFELFVAESLAPSPAVWFEFEALYRNNLRFKNCEDIPPYKLAKILNMTKMDYRTVYEETQRFLRSH